MSIVFQCSIRKANSERERAILIEAGLLTEALHNTWIRYRQWFDGEWRVTAENGYTNTSNIIVTATQLVTIINMHKLNPAISVRDLLKTFKLNKRNKLALKYTQYRDLA